MGETGNYRKCNSWLCPHFPYRQGKIHSKKNSNHISGDNIKRGLVKTIRDIIIKRKKEKMEHAMQDKLVEAKDKMGHSQEKLSTKVHGKAEELESNLQDKLGDLRGKIASVKEAGEKFQENVKQEHGGTKVKTAKDLKSATDIKGASEVKSSKDIPHYFN